MSLTTKAKPKGDMMALNGFRKGVGFCVLLTIVFVVMKLLDKIAWSWWWVLSPLWMPAGIIVAVVLIVLVACLTIRGLADISRALRRRKDKDV